MKGKQQKLATKIAIIISIMLTVVFTALILFTVLSTQKALKTAVNEQFSITAKSSAAIVQEILDKASSAANDIQEYTVDAYDRFALVSEATKNSDNKQSVVYKKPLSNIGYELENYIIATARSTVKNNVEVTGVGAFFEEYKYSPNIKDYTIYIANEDISTGNIQTHGVYKDYSEADYYRVAKETGKPYFTDPYKENGVDMITASYPVIYNNDFQGVIMVDIDITKLDRAASKSDQFKSMWTSVYTEREVLVYDSATDADTGKKMETFFKIPSEFKMIQENKNKGVPFTVETTREDGQKASRFYHPVKAGDSNWWSITSLNSNDLNATATMLSVTLLIISIISLAIILLVIIAALKKMLNPIKGVVDAAEQISKGNFDIHLEAKSNDEIGTLTMTFDKTANILKNVISDISRVLNQIASGDLTAQTSAHYVGDLKEIKLSIDNILKGLNSVLSDINQSAEQVASGSDQVSMGAQALSSGATEQASSIEELSATVNDISDKIKGNANNATQASSAMDGATSALQQSNDKMGEMARAMAEISGTSSEIGKIIKVIDDIAFQTNILALNAAVEAARAGTAGKGFAVVADEVRSLASKSAEAAKSTSALIASAISAVENGTHIADDTAAFLQNAVTATFEVNSSITEISNASSEQASAVSQVTLGMEQISAVVQTNSATAEESAAASEELNAQAQIMKELVGKFKLNG